MQLFIGDPTFNSGIPHATIPQLINQPSFCKPKFNLKLNLMENAERKEFEKMAVLNPHAAGIDVGSREHYVAVGQGKEHVRRFGVYTADLIELCQWLKDSKITSVALESTGSYWKNLFVMLQQHELNPILVNGRFTKNLKGKKTDMLDCQFIQKMHSLGLLPDSFQPDDFTEKVRNLVRYRSTLISQGADTIKRMQQSLRLMNIRLDVAITDITGKSGMTIIQAILSGERDAARLASLASVRVKKSKEEITQALTGFYRSDCLFQLKQLHNLYQMLGHQIEDLDVELNKMLEKQLEDDNKNDLLLPNQNKAKKQRSKNEPAFNLEHKSYQFYEGINLMQVPGIGASTLLTIISELGDNIHKFKTAKHFCSWLRLAPNKKVSGGKVLSNFIEHGANTLAIALRNAANSIGNMKAAIPLTSFFRRIAFRYGRAAAITATARKLAVIIWNMLSKKQPYQEQSNEKYEERIRRMTLKNIQHKIIRHGIKLEDLKFAGA
jgi:transposase